MLDKPCLKPGCKAAGIYGLGSIRKGTMVWACAAHRVLLEAMLTPPSPGPVRAPQPDLFSHAR